MTNFSVDKNIEVPVTDTKNTNLFLLKNQGKSAGILVNIHGSKSWKMYHWFSK